MLFFPMCHSVAFKTEKVEFELAQNYQISGFRFTEMSVAPWTWCILDALSYNELTIYVEKSCVAYSRSSEVETRDGSEFCLGK